jgi:hypothetical protein
MIAGNKKGISNKLIGKEIFKNIKIIKRRFSSINTK